MSARGDTLSTRERRPLADGPPDGFARAAAAVERSGRRYRHSHAGQLYFSCPGPGHAHGDRRMSGSLTRGPDGAGIFCHGGCSAEDIAAGLGFDLRDLFDHPKRAREYTFPPDTGTWAAVESAWMPCHDRGHRVVAAYNYTTIAGRFLAQKLRCDRKDFSWRRLDPTSRNGWRYNRRDVEVRLYRPDVIAWAIGDERVLYLAEGEKDVEAFLARRVPATCSPDGAWVRSDRAGKWRPEYTEMLRGAHLCIVADRDKDGRAHAENVAGAVLDVVASLEICVAADGPDGAPLKDVSDHFDAGHTLGELVTVAEPKPYRLPDAVLAADETYRATGLDVDPDTGEIVT